MDAYEQDIRRLVLSGMSHAIISEYLSRKEPNRRGFSERSVRRFCSERNIHYRSGLTDAELDRRVMVAIRAVGHSYGRRMLHGYLRSGGLHVSQRRVGAALSRVAPRPAQSRRAQTHRQLNPIPYRSDYFGQKLHLDQNEKLGMFGVTHILAVDGFSRKIVGMVTMPVKNAITIYHTLLRPLLITEGLWEQIRVDHGTEFALVATVQTHLACYRRRTSRPPYLRTSSTHNLRVERLWVEVNQRVNYPVKRALVAMESAGEINMGDEITRFCVSWTTINVLQSAKNNFVAAWNEHRLPGSRGGIPNVLARRENRIVKLTPASIPSTHTAIQLHEHNRHQLTRESSFGTDPLASHPRLSMLRERDFMVKHPSLDDIMRSLLHGDFDQFKLAVTDFIQLTRSYSRVIGN